MDTAAVIIFRKRIYTREDYLPGVRCPCLCLQVSNGASERALRCDHARIPTTFRGVVVLIAVAVSEKRPNTATVVGVAIRGDVVVIYTRGTGVHAREATVYAAGEGQGAHTRACTAITAVVP